MSTEAANLSEAEHDHAQPNYFYQESRSVDKSIILLFNFHLVFN
jgi:hypothetical protein